MEDSIASRMSVFHEKLDKLREEGGRREEPFSPVVFNKSFFHLNLVRNSVENAFAYLGCLH